MHYDKNMSPKVDQDDQCYTCTMMDTCPLLMGIVEGFVYFDDEFTVQNCDHYHEGEPVERHLRLV